MKLLAVYNQFNQSNIPFYVDAIRSILSQKDVDLKLAVSGCCSTDMVKIQLMNTFHNHISYNFIEDNVPVSVSFNDTVDKMHKHFGRFDATLYVDSGISFWDPGQRYDSLAKMIDVHKSGPYAMTAAMISNDIGDSWWAIPQEALSNDYVFKLGQTTNLHAQIFDRAWKEAYGMILPDVFRTHCMESVFTGMAAAINKKFIRTTKLHLLHNHSMDGASLGGRTTTEDSYPMSNVFELGGVWFKKQKTADVIYREGYELGFSIEECKPYYPHNPDAYDENGFAKSPLLKDFYKKEMYLAREEFDYGSLRYQFHPGQ